MNTSTFPELIIVIACLLVSAALGFLIGWYTKSMQGRTSRKTNKHINNQEFNSTLAKATFKKNISKNDFKIIDGIGPKIEELLKSRGIESWFELSKTSKEDLKKILEEAGERFSLHSPESWPQQAEYAANNQWIELKELQNS